MLSAAGTCRLPPMQTLTFPIADLAASLGLEPEEVSPWDVFLKAVAIDANDNYANPDCNAPHDCVE